MTLLLVVGVAVLTALGLPPAALGQLMNERAPMAWVRYVERRLEGHPRLEALAWPVLAGMRRHLEREPPPNLPDLGKGQRPAGVSRISYDAQGRPVAGTALHEAARPPLPDKLLGSVEEIMLAIKSASPGEVLEVRPGTYTLRQPLYPGRPGTALQPITLRARQPGTVTFLAQVQEAVVAGQPYWVFENLDWRGVCELDEYCEHAYHVVGAARGTVIVNNHMADFNAQVKVNGFRGEWPDDGLLQFNTLINLRGRKTSSPVAPFDLVAASGWQVLDNRVENFVKADSDRPTYGLYMKGAGRGGRIERNLVVCTPDHLSLPGVRVGISLGNGGTSPDACLDQRCETEHADGLVANNVVAHCNDAGVDVAKARNARVLHNTLINTQGVVVRNPPSNALVERNLMEGSVRPRQGTVLAEADNERGGTVAGWLQQPDALDLRWRQLPDRLLPRHEAVPRDFCGRPRPAVTPAGATLGQAC